MNEQQMPDSSDRSDLARLAISIPGAPDSITLAGAPEDARFFGINAAISCTFKSPEDRAAFDISAVGTGEADATDLHWPALTGQPRLYIDIDALRSRVPPEATRLTLELVVNAASDTLATSPIEWIALLAKNETGAYAFWKKIAERPPLGPEMAQHTFGAALPSAREFAEHDMRLAIQLDAGPASLTLGDLVVSILSFETEEGSISFSAPSHLSGWIAEPTEHSRIVITAGARSLPTFEQRVTRNRFTVDVEAQTERLRREDEPSALLMNGSRRLAYLDLSKYAPSRDFSEAAGPQAEIEAGAVKCCYEEQDHEGLFRWFAASPLVEKDHCPETRGEAHLLFYHARVLLETNAAQSAYEGLRKLVDTRSWQTFFSPDEASKVRKMLARACVRSGRIEEAVRTLDELRLRSPIDWEAHFQLATTLPSSELSRRTLHFEIANELTDRFPETAHVAYLENLLACGRAGEALAQTLARAKTHTAFPQLWLTAANCYLELADRPAWSAMIDRFYSAFDLAAPVFEAEDGGAGFHSIFAQERTADTPQDDALVTVAMTAFNASATIAMSIRSVLAQSHRKLRIVVVDDCSTDDTVEIVRAIQQEDARVELVCNSVNVGTYCSKNVALRDFSSDFYTFHDSDDWMHPARIAEHLAAARTGKGIHCTTSLWIRMDGEGRIMPRKVGGYLHENPCSSFISRQVVDELGYFDSVRTGADSEFIWRIRRHFGRQSVVPLSRPLGVGLHHAMSLTQSGVAAFDENRFSATRMRYWESWVRWHRESIIEHRESLFVPFANPNRSFPAPEEILSVAEPDT